MELNKQYGTGKKALLFLWIKLCFPGVVLFCIAVLFYVVNLSGSLSSIFPVPVGSADLGKILAVLSGYFSVILIVLSAVYTTLMIFVGWVIHQSITFTLEDESLKINRGVFYKEEVFYPYQQIQNVQITRSLTDRLYGISTINILTAARATANSQVKTDGKLSCLDKTVAETLQDELLDRCQSK